MLFVLAIRTKCATPASMLGDAGSSEMTVEAPYTRGRALQVSDVNAPSYMAVFDMSVDTSVVSGTSLYDGAAVIGTKVIFAPWNANNIGVFDLSTSSFTVSASVAVSTANCVSACTTGSLTTTSNEFSGAAVVGHDKVIFAPFNSDWVGVYNVDHSTFDTSVSTSTAAVGLTDDGKFMGAAAVGTKVVFVPYNAGYVGVYDASTATFDATAASYGTSGDVGSDVQMFSGAAVWGTKVVFAPYASHKVGVYDVGTSILDTSVATGTLTHGKKFRGAAVAGTKVVFAPFKSDYVGVLTFTSTFGSVSFAFDVVSTGLTDNQKFDGAAIMNFRGQSRVIFAPYNADVIGIYDVDASTFDSETTGTLTDDQKFAGAVSAAVGTDSEVIFVTYRAGVVGRYSPSFDSTVQSGSLTSDNKYSGAAAVGTKVVFAPSTAAVVGVFDVSTGTFEANIGSTGTADGSADGSIVRKYSGAAAVGTKVVFAPHAAATVGVYDVATSTLTEHTPSGGLATSTVGCDGNAHAPPISLLALRR